MALYSVTTSNARLEYDTTKALEPSCFVIDSNHFINFWYGDSDYQYAQVFVVNTSTFAVTTAGAKFNFNTTGGYGMSCFKIDTNHFIGFYGGSGSDGYVQAFTVNTTTWAVTTANNPLEFDTDNCSEVKCYQIDATHFLGIWSNTSLQAQVFTVSTSTWAVTTANSRLQLDGDASGSMSCSPIDTNHFIVFWRGAIGTGSYPDGWVQVITVNTSTWAVTTAGASLDFDTTYNGGGLDNNCYQIDANHFINFWALYDSKWKGYVQTFTVNTSTWAVTTASARLNYDTQKAIGSSCFKIDTNHFINFWAGETTHSYTQSFTVNTSTYEVTTSAARLEFDTTVDSNGNHTCYKVDTNHFIDFWITADNNGMVQVFTVELSTAGPANVKTYKGLAAASVKSKKGLAIASIKSVKGLN